MKITKLLVANRGEIACRIFETCADLGIATVAVYSDADARARHVRLADEAVHVGASPAAESYLKQDAILAAAKAMGADAIHPGYGFLSENADFAEAVAKAGIIWVGPTPESIRAMGLKDEAKRLAEEAGVPVLPGYRGEAQDLATLTDAAKSIGYPLLIKAIAGGGGRGIRLVSKASEMKTELTSAVREAEAAFGDGRVMLEKLVELPRHIEVQVFGDTKGNAVHLYERDCSLQRRRQKVVEEAPAPGMPDDVRAAMTDAAVKLAKAVKYQGAGTVEFIVDGARPLATDTFWFLEMNTRLQVEHPVTELITGTDLVEWQLRVASGEALPLKQADIEMNGHAVEARLCAEDPADDFRPGAGLILEFSNFFDSEDASYRLDTGFETGDRIPSHYDSMIAKLIHHGDTREGVLEEMEDTLAATTIAGVPSNVGFLRRCIMAEAFQDASHHVNWIGEMGEALTHAPAGQARVARSFIAAHVLESVPGADPWGAHDGFRLNAAPTMRASVSALGEAEWAEPFGEDASFDDAFPLATTLSPRRFAVTTGGDTLLVEVPDYDADAEALLGGDMIKAPMPGKLLSLTVKPGDRVTQGDTLAVMEAMKMEHALAAPRDGIVEAIEGKVGEQISEGTVLVKLEDE